MAYKYIVHYSSGRNEEVDSKEDLVNFLDTTLDENVKKITIHRRKVKDADVEEQPVSM